MKTLDQWLAWQQRVHPHEIELGLERVRAVWQRMGARRPAPCVITVGGTNGKGSTVALLEAMLQATGKRVGCYTSPHLQRYNERIRLCGNEVGDAELIAVFERIEKARGDIALTWFEYGTLAALECMADAGLDVALLEVGLGGRLDAVNLVDADAAIVTSIGIDHVEYLGPDRDSIGKEKAGIFRTGCPAIIGDPDPPRTLLEEARRIGARALCLGTDFALQDNAGSWQWWFSSGEPTVQERLMVPAAALDLPGRSCNLASALAALFVLRDRLPWNPEAYAAASVVRVPGRIQQLGTAPRVVVDVAHNRHAARMLAAWLREHPVPGETRAVFGAMSDKDVAGVAAELSGLIRHWHVCPLPQAGSRGLDADGVRQRLLLGDPAARISVHDGVVEALAAAYQQARPTDQVLAFGSFHLVGAVLQDWAASPCGADHA